MAFLRTALVCAAMLVCGLAAAHAGEDLYNPLAVGLVWTGDVVATSADGRSLQGKMTREITGTRVIEGKTYFTMETRVEGIPGMKSFTTYRRHGEDGVYAISAADPKLAEFMESPRVMTPGRVWEVPMPQGKMIFRVEGIEPVTVGEVTYKDCCKVSYRSDTLPFRSAFYLARNVGSVTETIKSGDATIVFLLRSFTRRGEKVEMSAVAMP